MNAPTHELYGLAWVEFRDEWVEFRDEDTRRYLGKLNVTTGELVLPHRGRECRFNVADALKAIITTNAPNVVDSKP